ncbi:unnamed protein product [Arctogadus glacialis]
MGQGFDSHLRPPGTKTPPHSSRDGQTAWRTGVLSSGTRLRLAPHKLHPRPPSPNSLVRSPHANYETGFGGWSTRSVSKADA